MVSDTLFTPDFEGSDSLYTQNKISRAIAELDLSLLVPLRLIFINMKYFGFFITNSCIYPKIIKIF